MNQHCKLEVVESSFMVKKSHVCWAFFSFISNMNCVELSFSLRAYEEPNKCSGPVTVAPTRCLSLTSGGGRGLSGMPYFHPAVFEGCSS